jgi:hypothetical protein
VEAAVGIETDGRRKEIADKILALAEKSELFCAYKTMLFRLWIKSCFEFNGLFCAVYRRN